MKTLKRLALLALLPIALISCSKKDDPTPSPVPAPSASFSITAISPDYGKAGTEITVTGTGFSSATASNTVTFGGKTAVVTSATATQLKITAPADGTHGVLEVKVGTATASGPVFYYEPEVASLSATSGKTGDALTITGNNFGTVSTDFEVKFNGTLAEITAATLTTLAVKVPQGAATGAITVARKTKTPVTGPVFTVTTSASNNLFTVTEGSITITNLLKTSGTYGQALCFTVDETNNIMYVGTTTQILKIDLATSAITTMLTNSSFLNTAVSKPSAMDIGADGKLYLLIDVLTLNGIPPTGGNVYSVNTATNTATLAGNKYIGINAGGYTGYNIPFMVTSNNEFITLDGQLSTLVKYSSDLSVRTVIYTFPILESFSHLVKNANGSIRIVGNSLSGKFYVDYTTAASAKTDYSSALATDMVSITRGGSSFYELKSKNAADATTMTPFRMLYTVGKLNPGQTDYEKKASFTIDKYMEAATYRYYNFITLNGKTFFTADKNGNMYAIILPNTDSDAGIYKFSIN